MALNRAKRKLKLQKKKTHPPMSQRQKGKKLKTDACEEWYCKICEEKSIEDMIRCLK